MNPWDTLSSLFTGEASVDGIPQGAADNVLSPIRFELTTFTLATR
jgi:hypothetical protein